MRRLVLQGPQGGRRTNQRKISEKGAHRLQQEKEAAAVIRTRRRASRRIEAPSGLKHVNNRHSYTAV